MLDVEFCSLEQSWSSDSEKGRIEMVKAGLSVIYSVFRADHKAPSSAFVPCGGNTACYRRRESPLDAGNQARYHTLPVDGDACLAGGDSSPEIPEVCELNRNQYFLSSIVIWTLY